MAAIDAMTDVLGVAVVGGATLMITNAAMNMMNNQSRKSLRRTTRKGQTKRSARQYRQLNSGLGDFSNIGL
jgi:hypothetical protein